LEKTTKCCAGFWKKVNINKTIKLACIAAAYTQDTQAAPPYAQHADTRQLLALARNWRIIRAAILGCVFNATPKMKRHTHIAKHVEK
jgi:hypothetical protein